MGISLIFLTVSNARNPFHSARELSQAVADPAGAVPPRWRPENFFRQYINIITKPTAYDGPWEY